MRRLALALLLLTFASGAAAAPSADRLAALRRGVNLTNWFRFPASTAPSALQTYIGDAALADLRNAGFTFVRLAVDPAFLLGANGALDSARLSLVIAAIGRIERQGLAVVVELHPSNWQPERSAADGARLLSVWRELAPALRPFDPRLTFPEILNEPVFTADPADWDSLQRSAAAAIRAALPANTLVASGNDWSSVDGLLRLHPLADANIVYSFHFYEPAVLTGLGTYQAGLDAGALAALPFPVVDVAPCVATPANAATRGAVRYYCGGQWDASRVAARIALASGWGQRHGVPVIAGEFGALQQLNAPARLAWLRAVRQACEANGLGWALWGYEDGFGFAVPRPPGDRPRLDPTILAALGLHSPP
ncbi:MAG: cellulase family glycosylhydrolase [Acetobacteraceae bacterium]|nr:cellulase family glycosylhydrolase [Acetobacteraceae bacterium]